MSSPPLLGSGKFRTPCARRHAAYSIVFERPAALGGRLTWPDEPQPAIVALERTAMTKERTLLRQLEIILMARL